METNGQEHRTPSNRFCRVSLSGFNLINSPRLNKGTAFTDHERDVFDLHGLLPPHVGSLDEQIERRLQALRDQPTSFNKYSFLRDLQDTNETLFYALLLRHVEEMLPLVYTPTVGEGCQRFARFGESRVVCSSVIRIKIASTRSSAIPATTA
jgi:malate dehydrogenase (oxaloacetate-decarboxylating)